VIATELRAGDELDGYRIEARLHAGGMAVIYGVSRADLPGPAVMKVPRLGHGEPGATIVSFEVEQMMLGIAGGGPVPTLYAQGDMAVAPYLVMEHVEGVVLSAEAEQLPWSIERLTVVGVAVAEAVHALHQRDIIHLDLKPSNIIMRPDGSAVLIDLGLAHHAQMPDLLAEEIRRPLGSAPYISPEQVLGVRSEPRSDIFALGVMLYEFATGKLPFGSPTGITGMRKRLRMQPMPPRAYRTDLPPYLQEIILRCLEVDPSRRYTTASQLAFDLQHPEKVVLSERSRTTRRSGAWRRFRHWIFGLGFDPVGVLTPRMAVSQAPIVQVFVDTSHTSERRQDALRNEAARMARALPEARLAFVAVAREQPAMGQSDDARSGPREHLRMLVELRHWAESVNVEPARTTCHVLESNDSVEAVLDYARVNQVDTLLICAPNTYLSGSRILPSVAEKIILHAPCTVVVARAPQVTRAAETA